MVVASDARTMYLTTVVDTLPQNEHRALTATRLGASLRWCPPLGVWRVSVWRSRDGLSPMYSKTHVGATATKESVLNHP